MTSTDNVIKPVTVTQPRFRLARHLTPGFVPGAIGVLAFSMSLPATRVAEAGGLDPVLVGCGRAAVAGVLALALLGIIRQPWPRGRDWPRIGLVALGVVFGFPLFSALALEHLTAAHGAVIVGVLPAATAIIAVVRAGERPPVRFWIVSGAGLVAVLLFAAVSGAGAPSRADLLVLVAVGLGALGYAEGGVLARHMGGWQVICWALVLSLPVTMAVTGLDLLHDGIPHAGVAAWSGFAYVSLVSMFLGFFVWYRGLARGGIARIGQIQLAQPVLTLIWSALLLGERVTPLMAVTAFAVLGCVLMSQRTRAAPVRVP